ncbi:adenylate/guanylate cyclase domain-containing protein [Aurantiacibacter sp. MUD11]|uniref:adenylate/guanylate cyclase domain-containing protein n=1 Tax=Aurantiacibacter sp. MUD11 TaxID=3003265 RepID=UPI0022AA7F0A|nr:adenylate/guanylate cyclase domain-containing protein [Aurantiacibacter sp. MUD11]WAT18150.1 adenylate/guanylate cyclase domain-containing protein [Aurantiacibacter sp. MUD11]
MTKGGSAVPFRFDDKEAEQAYVVHERTQRIPATRFLCAIAVATLITYIGFNPMHFPRDGVIEYNIAAGLMIAVLGATFAATYTRFYVERPWVDIIIFSVLAVPMVMLLEALAAQADITGISRFGMAIVQLGILVVFASVGFVASLRNFLIWAAALVTLYLIFLLEADRSIVSKVYTFTNFTTFLTFATFVNWDIDRRARKTWEANRALEAERAKVEEMLHNVLPQDVAERLRKGEAVADSFADVSVIFVDIVGFSQLAKALSPGRLVKMLNEIFLLADEAAEKHCVEKVKTIGDAYLAVAGGHGSGDSGASCAIRFGCELIDLIGRYADRTKIDVQVRVGIHTGPVVGGVIGQQRLAYDYWGDTMNIASRIEGIAHPGGIAVSESVYYGANEEVDFSEPELATLKGVGEVKIYRVIMPE